MFVRRLALLAGMGIAVCVLYVVGMEYKVWIERSDTFHVRKVEIEGNDLLSNEEMLRLGGLSPKSSIWGMDLMAAEDAIGKHAFIKSVCVHRLLPDVIRVRVEEKSPVALLNFRGMFYCIDWEGVVLPSKPGKLYDLPILSGDLRGAVSIGQRVGGKAVDEGLLFLTAMMKDRPELYSRISEIVLGRPEGLVLYTSQSGIPVWIGDGGYTWKVRCLEAILDELVHKGEFSQIRYIDLRFRGQVVVGMRA